jgi:hypothetical protein
MSSLIAEPKETGEREQQNIPHQRKNRAGRSECFSKTTAIDAEAPERCARQGNAENEQQTGDQKQRSALESFQDQEHSGQDFQPGKID